MIRTGAINWSNPVARCGLNDGLVSWWLGRGPRIGGGTWCDLCGRYNGTLTNMTPANDWVASTRPGGSQALDLDGSNDQATIPTMPMLTTFTLSCWVYPRSVTSGYDTIICNNGYSRGWFLTNVSSANRPNYYNSGDNLATTAVSLNTWSHVAVVYVAGSTCAHYLNGAANGSTTPSASGTEFNSIGAYNSTTFQFDGLLDDMRVFSRALSSAEVQALYADSLAGYPQTLNRLRRRFAYQAAGGGTMIPVFVHHYRMQGAA